MYTIKELIQTDLLKISDNELLRQAEYLAKIERKVTTELLRRLCEIERRRAYAKKSVPSLFEYCTKILKLSESAANRRIKAARLLGQMPELEAKIEDGSLNISNLTQAQTFFNKEEQATGEKPSLVFKKEIIEKLENKSARAAERVLVDHASFETVPTESIKALKNNLTQLTLILDQEMMDQLNRLKEIWSHKMPHATYADIIRELAKQVLPKVDPLLREVKPKKTPPTSEVNSVAAKKSHARSRHIPNEIRRLVFKRDQCCTYTDEKGTRCQSRHFLEPDHIIPFAKGGESTFENLRMLCRAHNQLYAQQEFRRPDFRRHYRQ